MTFSSSLPLVILTGDRLDGLYNLGLQDRSHYRETYKYLQNTLKTPWARANKLASKGMEAMAKYTFKNNPSFEKTIKAYSEGLGISATQYTSILLVIEMISTPRGHLWGGSSYLSWDEKEGLPLHAHFLNSPLGRGYDKYERAILYKFKNLPQIFSYGTAGIPYPSFMAMNQWGITLSFHQKSPNSFFRKGTPIFEVANDLLYLAEDKKSALEILKKSFTMASWSLTLSFPNGDVLTADLRGEENFIRQRDLSMERQETQVVKEGDLRLLKALATPRGGLANAATLAATVFNARRGRSLYVDGPAPKFFRGTYHCFDHIWDNPRPTQELKKENAEATEVSHSYHRGMREFFLAQTQFDLKDWHQAYHHIQMSIEYLATYPEQKIAQFYFAVFEFIHNRHKKILPQILERFKALKNQLPPNLNDHALLFIWRLERILGITDHSPKESIQSPHLRRLLSIEEKIPRLFLRAIVAKSSSLKMDLFDIVYTHEQIPLSLPIKD